MTRNIFVFGSNLLGEHHGGSARAAHDNHGARWGHARGLCGNSYAIPTLGKNYEKLPLEDIDFDVRIFRSFARQHRDMKFNIVAIGCGIAGFKPDEIGPMFANAPDNCVLPKEFEEYRGKSDLTEGG